LSVVQLLWAFVLASTTFAEDDDLRRIAQHGVQPAAGPERRGTCVKDTSRPCRHWTKGTIVDHTTQCVGGSGAPFLAVNPVSTNASAHQAYCSADKLKDTLSGSCICGPGYCADTDMLCHRGSYQIINEVFTITTKAYPEEKLYMTADGKVKVGVPPDPRAAQWRISVTGKGVKILWTELYTNTILQEYETCSTMTDQFGLSFTKCALIVGNVPDPRAGEMGWYIEIFGDQGGRFGMLPAEVYVQLRSVDTWDMFFISPFSKEGRACEARGRNCPGDSGAFKFDPPLMERMDFVLDTAPGSLPPGLAAYRGTVIAVFILLGCLMCVFTADAKSLSGVTKCLKIPLQQLARTLGVPQGATI